MKLGDVHMTSDIEKLQGQPCPPVGAGEPTDFGRDLDSYRNYLLLLARVQIGRRLQGKVDATDLVQDTLLSAHRDLASFRGTTEKEFAGWLRRILACRLADLSRRYLGTKRRDVRLERQWADDLDRSSQALSCGLVARQSSPSQHVARREEAVLLADALERLPHDYSEVIILRHMEGLSFPVIATRLGRSLDSVEKLWARGLVRLRRVLGGPS
jgi:RNA polymerase sigma-70 factor (ECF subfamily)